MLYHQYISYTDGIDKMENKHILCIQIKQPQTPPFALVVKSRKISLFSNKKKKKGFTVGSRRPPPHLRNSYVFTAIAPPPITKITPRCR